MGQLNDFIAYLEEQAANHSIYVSVSYTHLDVYKRQPIRRAGRPERRRRFAGRFGRPWNRPGRTTRPGRLLCGRNSGSFRKSPIMETRRPRAMRSRTDEKDGAGDLAGI